MFPHDYDPSAFPSLTWEAFRKIDINTFYRQTVGVKKLYMNLIMPDPTARVVCTVVRPFKLVPPHLTPRNVVVYKVTDRRRESLMSIDVPSQIQRGNMVNFLYLQPRRLSVRLAENFFVWDLDAYTMPLEYMLDPSPMPAMA